MKYNTHMGETRVLIPPGITTTKPEIPEMRYGKGEYHGPSRDELGTMEFPNPAESDPTVVQNGLE